MRERFDDTNPDEEEEVYFEWILKIIRWLGRNSDLPNMRTARSNVKCA
jgi:glutamyl/glutaminyl-tRNA synthetase